MDRRAIGSSLLALAFGPVALGAIALGAATAASGPASIAASAASHEDSPRLAVGNDSAADDITESAGERTIAVLGPSLRVDGRGIHAPVFVDTRYRGVSGDAAILSFAPKTSPPV